MTTPPMRTTFRIALPILFSACATMAHAQANGIRLIFPEFTKVYADKGMFSTYQVGFGYVHDFNDNLSMSLEFAIDLQRATNDNTANGFENELSYQGYSAYYTSFDKLSGLKYHTAYAFGDNGGTHFYLGSFVGFRRFSQEVEINPIDNGSGDDPFVNRASGDKTLFPIGLRSGIRGSLEGGWADLYVDLGYVIGGGESVFTQPYLQGEGFDLSSLNLSLGLAYGFGW